MKPDETVFIYCAKCGMKYEIPAEYVGQQLQCDSCGATFSVPFPQGSHYVEDPYHVEPEETVSVDRQTAEEALRLLHESHPQTTEKIAEKKTESGFLCSFLNRLKRTK